MTEYSQFAAGLAFLGNLSPTEVVALLEEHSRHLKTQMNDTQASIGRGLQIGVDRLFLTEDRYTLALLEARLTFIQQFLLEVSDGTLTETRDGKLVWRITRLDLAFLGSEMQKEHDELENNEM
jgi:hypothetical protein